MLHCWICLIGYVQRWPTDLECNHEQGCYGIPVVGAVCYRASWKRPGVSNHCGKQRGLELSSCLAYTVHHLFDPFLGLTTPPIQFSLSNQTSWDAVQCFVWGIVAILRFLQETWSALTVELLRVPKRGRKTWRALGFVIYACVEPTLSGRICRFVPIWMVGFQFGIEPCARPR